MMVSMEKKNIETNGNLDIFELGDLSLEHLEELLVLGYEVDAIEYDAPPAAESLTLAQVVEQCGLQGKEPCYFSGHVYHPKHYAHATKKQMKTLKNCTWWDQDTFYIISPEARALDKEMMGE
jgi:hypothetical protein